jgi:hypothetical protein
MIYASDYDKASALISDLTDQLNRLRVEHDKLIAFAIELSELGPFAESLAANKILASLPSQCEQTPPAAS